MALWIKICGITSVEDARMVERAGADALGLIFAPGSPRIVTVQRAAEICESLSTRIRKVGVFVLPDWEGVEETLERVPLDLLQWHGGPLSCEDYARISGFGLPWIHVVRWGGESPIEAPAGASMLLVEGRSEKGFGGTGESWNYQGLSSATWPLPLLLSGGLSPDRVGEAIRSLCPRIPFGVDVSSGVEFSPGRKDEKKVIDFIQRVRRSEEKS